MTRTCSRPPGFQEAAAGQATVRLRPDLNVVTIRNGLAATVVIKDPLTLKYFRLEEFELALLQQFDGRRTLEEVRRWFERTFAPTRLSGRELHELVWQWYQQGLLTSTAAAQGPGLVEQRTRDRRRARWQLLRRPWIVRFTGIDPTRLLDVTVPCTGWIFHPVFVLLLLPFLAAGLVLCACNAESFSESLPTLEAFLDARNLMLLAGCIGLAKAAHELGHATAARRFGCECHELGVLLLFGIPTLYCDVSDAWVLPERSRRMAISLGGVWVELLIAAVAAGIWWWSVPGLIHSLSFNLMLVCSASTLFFNANPLLRYDGYYVLMDLTGIPNLADKARQSMAGVWNRVVFGLPDRSRQQGQWPAWLPVFGAASLAWQCAITLSIVYVVHASLKPLGLASFAWLLAISFVASLLWEAGSAQVRGFRTALKAGVPFMRVACGLLLAVAGILAVGFCPWPWYAFADTVLEPAVVSAVYAPAPGKLRFQILPGDVVASGGDLAELENPELSYRLEQVSGDCERLRSHLDALKARRGDDPEAESDIPTTQARLDDALKQRQLLQQQVNELRIVAHADGQVIPAPLRSRAPQTDALATWDGTLLDEVNARVWVETGELICQIAASPEMDAVAYVPQDDIERLGVGQSAQVLLTGFTDRPLNATVHEISPLDLRDDARESILPDSVQWVNGPDGSRTLATALYQVRLRITDECPAGTRCRGRGVARIRLGQRSGFAWLLDTAQRTFRWEL